MDTLSQHDSRWEVFFWVCYWEVLRTSPVYLSSCFLKHLDAILVKDGREVQNIKILSHLVELHHSPPCLVRFVVFGFLAHEVFIAGKYSS